jgi:hypothetical protein
MARSLPELAMITSPSSVTSGLTTKSLGLLPNENPLEASPEKLHNSEPVFTSMACTAVLLARYATLSETDNPNQVVEPVHPLNNTAASRITVTSKIFFLIAKIVLLWNGVIAPGVKRITAQHTPGRHG